MRFFLDTIDSDEARRVRDWGLLDGILFRPELAEGKDARRLLSDQLTAAVRWVECMQRAARLGGEDARFVEIGPGAVLAGLLKRIVPEANVVSLGTADEVTKFMEAA